MLSEIAPEEFAAALDAVVDDILAEADWPGLPVNAAVQVAQRLGLDVAYDTRQAGRARFVNLCSATSESRQSILLRPEPRPERVQWAVAHELGEKLFRCAFFGRSRSTAQPPALPARRWPTSWPAGCYCPAIDFVATRWPVRGI